MSDGDAIRPLGELSPGQRRRVALAALVAEPPALLLLDEPTNHLSLALAEDLEQALEDFPGTVVLATHDRWLRRRWRGRVVGVEPPRS
jgi:macrolide transport system ATP-binding/permease protein